MFKEAKITILKDGNLLWKWGAKGLTFFPFIFIKKSYWKELEKDNVRKRALIIHEKVHWGEQKERFGIWHLEYALSKKSRFRKELRAYKAEYDFYTKNGRDPKKERYARVLSSKTYWNMVSYNEALKEVEKWKTT